MHILQVHGWWKVDQPGGVITMMKTLAAALEERGHRVTVLAGDWNARDIEEDEEGGRPFYRLRLPAPPRRAWHLKGWLGWLRDLPRAVRRLRRFAEERGIDVVHLHWPRPYFFAFRFLRMRRGPPYIVTLHLTDVTSFAELPRSHRHLVKSVVDHAAARTAVSSWLAAEGERRLCPGHSVGVVYNGIDPEDVAEAPEAELEPYRGRLPERYFAMLANLHPYKGHDVAAEQVEMAEAIGLHTEVTGERPLGWYTGRGSMNTVDLASEEGGFLYVADSYADDLPYWHEHGGRQQLVVPYTLDANDMRFATPQGFNSGEQFFAYLKDSFDVLYAEGIAGRPKMLSIGLHCRLAGRPGRAASLARFIDHCQRHEKVWFARRIDIARHWHERHPPRPFERPSAMACQRFIERFGGVFEHSPWVAERAHELELGPAHDSAEGLWHAMARVFRSASQEERLGVLKAHPDLAGKLAQARRLTVESAAEQASAGLDVLTDVERARFEALNASYVERFGFPFIVAVKGLDKSAILDAFERRLENRRDEELATACREVERIARLRLSDMLPG